MPSLMETTLRMTGVSVHAATATPAAAVGSTLRLSITFPGPATVSALLVCPATWVDALNFRLPGDLIIPDPFLFTTKLLVHSLQCSIFNEEQGKVMDVDTTV